MYTRKRIGVRTEPCGTPNVTHALSDRAPLTETLFSMLKKKIFIEFVVFPVIP